MTKKTLNLTVIILFIFAFTACNKNKIWEYKIVNITSEEYSRTGIGSKYSTKEIPKDSLLNAMGAMGWELTSSYLEVETSFPNFGNEAYVTGIQPNIRPHDVVLIFKRIAK